MAETTRAVVIEGVPLVRVGITSLLREHRVAVVAEAATAENAAALVRGADAHLLVVGDAGDGVALTSAIARVKDRSARVHVVALVSRGTREELLAVLDAGADAIVPHDVDRDELLAAIDAVRRGERHLTASLTTILFASVRLEDADDTDEEPGLLTSREHAVVRLLAEGSTNDEIGNRLYISVATVKTHLSNVYEKLGARNRYDAVVKATQLGLI